MARLACIIAAGILILFVISGQALFRVLGITLPAFKIAGSIVLLLVALDMLRARRSPVKETMEETYAGTEKDDIAITPLAVPMLAGPGAISTTILLHSQSPDMRHTLALLACILSVCAASYLIFRVAAKGATRFISPIAMKIVERLMGLLLTAVAIQFAIDGFSDLGLLTPAPKTSSL
jgi:multiple antibiotic resistance protein